MNRGRALSAVALVLAVVALGTVAGGLSAGGGIQDEPSSGVGIGGGEGSGIGDGGGVGLPSSADDSPVLPSWLGLYPFLAVLWVALAGGLIAFVVFLWNVDVAEILTLLRKMAGILAAIAVGLIVVVIVLLFLAGAVGEGGGGLLGDSATDGAQVVGDASPADAPSLMTGIVIVAGVVVIGIVVLMLLSGRDPNEPGGSTSEPSPTDDTVERTGGAVRPAGTIEDAGPSNGVYEAWATFREQVGRADRTESPEELKRRAMAAGLDERAVSELTTLFNAARYGNRPVTSREERRARQALDSLEGSGGTT